MDEEYSDCCWSDWYVEKHPGVKVIHHRLVDYICFCCGEKCSLVSGEFVREESRKHHQMLKKLEEKYGKNFWMDEEK